MQATEDIISINLLKEAWHLYDWKQKLKKMRL